MSLQSSLVTVLSAIAGGRVYPQAAPQDAALPFVIYRRASREPTQCIDGTLAATRSVMVFECYATGFDAALTLAASVRAAIQASALTWTDDPGPGEDYEPVIDGYMEPVHYAFWH